MKILSLTLIASIALSGLAFGEFDHSSRQAISTIRAATIPEASFSGVPLSKVIQTLSILSVDYDNITPDGQVKGVSIVLIDPDRLDPTVKLTMRNATLEHILEYVTKSVGFRYDIESGAVVVRPGLANRTNLDTQTYPLSLAAIIRMIGFKESRSREEEEAALIDFFKRAGVGF